MCNVPSQCIHKEWLWVFNHDLNQSIIQFRECLKNPYAIGRWLIFASKGHVDELWGRMQGPTVLGKLGIAIQATSRTHADLYSKQGSHVISVYTYSVKDKEDIKRVRKKLEELGIHWKIRYILYLEAQKEGRSSCAKSIYYE